MSKLYDVISRLEDVAERDATGFETPEPTSGDKTKKLQSPSVRIIIFCLLFILLGTLAIALTAWWQNWFVQQDVTLFPKDLPVQQQPSLSANITSGTHPPDNAAPEKVQERTTYHQPLIVDDELLPDILDVGMGDRDRTVTTIDDFLKSEHFDQSVSKATAPLKNVKIYIHDLDIAEAVVEREPISVGRNFPTSQSTIINESKAKTSRWLHQAELYRHNGEWDGAIALYQRVWDITGEPGVANNLAAALIQVNRPEEALKILMEGSNIAPNDPDIKQNLTIIKQLLKQQ